MGNNAYTWDGANRIVNFKNNAGGTNSSFTYDGLNRLVRVIDRHNGAVTADHSYTWCGSVRCLAHDNTQSGSPVSTQYFAQGTIISGTSYYYVQDRLGSVNQLVTSSGSVASQYTYDPYGNRTTVSGTVVPDIGYAGYFYHAASGLDFTLNRAYDPVHARWLNRDPIGEMGGINLYAYALQNPVTYRDPSGEFVPLVTGAIGLIAGGLGDLVGQTVANVIAGRSLTNIDLTEVGVAAAVGGVAGAAAPFVVTGYAGAAALGGLANLIQTLTTNSIEGKCTSLSQAAFSAASGLAGGAFGGPVSKTIVFSEASQWLDSSTAAALNQAATEDSLYGIGNLFRSGVNGIISNLPNPF